MTDVSISPFLRHDVETCARGGHAAPSAARWLSLAATPTFAIMVLFTAIHGESMPHMLCSAARDGSALTGMVPMYLLMSAFHLSPWLKLVSSRRSGTRSA